MFTVFAAAERGSWRIASCTAVIGDALASAPMLSVAQTAAVSSAPPDALPRWSLAGVASHVRYVERPEKTALTRIQAGLGRPEASCAAMIPIRKSQAWWDLTQEERRAVFEAQSHHIAKSLKYLPAIARQLYHARDLGQPFDFITWFEFAPEHAAQFDDLVAMLRATPEWAYVTREVDLRLERAS
jgi:chlorite dismutase